MKKLMDREHEDAHRQIVVKPDDEGLFNFLLEVFNLAPNYASPGKVKDEPDVFPERITLRQCVIREDGREDVGSLLFGKEWKPTVSPQPKVEELVGLSNLLVQKAQHDCSQSGRRRLYTLQAHHAGKSAEPFARYLLSLTPGSKELAMLPDEDEGTSTKALLRELYRDRRFQQEHTARMFEQYHQAMDGLIARYEQRLATSESANAELLKTHMELIRVREEMLDKKLTRELRADRERFFQQKIQKGVDLLEGVVLPVIAHRLAGNTGPIRPNIPGGEESPQQPLRDFVAALSEEQALAFFGDVDLTTGRSLSPGLLDAAQVVIVLEALKGNPPPSRIAELVRSIKPEQVRKAQTILHPDQLAMLVSLMQSTPGGAAGGAP